MSHQLRRPSWVEQMENPPTITRYLGRASDAVEYPKGNRSRVRFQIDVEDGQISVSIAQAKAIVDMFLMPQTEADE